MSEQGETEHDPPTLGQSARVLGAHVLARGCGRLAAITTQIALRMSHDEQGLDAALRQHVERLNRKLTQRAHTFRRYVDQHGLRRLRDNWHMHGCLECGSGTACWQDCERGDSEQQLIGQHYEPRTCSACKRASTQRAA